MVDLGLMLEIAWLYEGDVGKNLQEVVDKVELGYSAELCYNGSGLEEVYWSMPN